MSSSYFKANLKVDRDFMPKIKLLELKYPHPGYFMTKRQYYFFRENRRIDLQTVYEEIFRPQIPDYQGNKSPLSP